MTLEADLGVGKLRKFSEMEETCEYVVELIEILPFPIENPPFFHDDHLKHILDVVVELTVLLD